MTTKGHAAGAEAVWPSGGWTMNEAGTEITRDTDNVVMRVLSISASSLRLMFVVADDVSVGGRIAALSGKYTFNLN